MSASTASLDAVPERIIESLGSQIDLLFTLSVAVSGGIIALVFQIAIHNRSMARLFRYRFTARGRSFLR
jgi:hypothetical protein